MASLFFKDPAAARFVAGGVPEAESLFGSPLPFLPSPEREGDKDLFLVRFDPQIRPLLQRFLQGLLIQVGAELPTPAPRAEALAENQAAYEALLCRTLRSIRVTDRRLGLQNLFWLALSKEAAECLRELEAKAPGTRRMRNSLHPFLSSFYRRLEQAARKDIDPGEAGSLAFLAGRENPGLIEAVIEDGFAFTESGSTELDLGQFLATNKRFRISAEAFAEIQQVLVREAERRLREGEKGLLTRIAHHLPRLPKEQHATPGGLLKIALSAPVMTYLLADAWNTGGKLTASNRLRAEADRGRKHHEIVDAFLDVVVCLKRFELLSHIRDRVTLLQAFGAKDLEDKFSRGLRVYEFGESAQVLNNAVNATVLFLDLRGFTKTSEGQISERDLTRELYAVFDAFVALVRQFGGTVDKFLGDGMMVTYGTAHADPAGPLNALRTSILCQEAISRLRQEGRTGFKMGVAIHYGRVYLARFLEDEELVQCTVIGRNVNLSGRLSSAAKRPMDEDEPAEPAPARPSGVQVTVDQSGALFNEGIAISRAALVQLETQVTLKDVEEGSLRRMEFLDDRISRKILIRYAGDAKFKGVRASFPVFEVDYE